MLTLPTFALQHLRVLAHLLIARTSTMIHLPQLNSDPQSKALLDFMFTNKSSIYVITGVDMDGDFAPNPLDVSRFVIPLPGRHALSLRKPRGERQTDRRLVPLSLASPLSTAPPPPAHAGRRVAH